MAFSAPTVDEAETDYEAIARQLNEAMAENVRSVPDWVTWKPLDFQASGASVFDAYYGEPENFCAGMGFRLLVDDPYGEKANRWQAGAGLGEPDADGYYGYGREAAIRKNADGDWSCDGLATGGSSVDLPLSAPGAEAPLSELAPCWTSGQRKRPGSCAASWETACGPPITGTGLRRRWRRPLEAMGRI